MRDFKKEMHDDELTKFEHLLLRVRNIFVSAAVLLFLLSILPIDALHPYHGRITGIAYLIGAFAYGCELLEHCDEEKRASKHHKRRTFMPNMFALLYILLGISHLFD